MFTNETSSLSLSLYSVNIRPGFQLIKDSFTSSHILHSSSFIYCLITVYSSWWKTDYVLRRKERERDEGMSGGGELKADLHYSGESSHCRMMIAQINEILLRVQLEVIQHQATGILNTAVHLKQKSCVYIMKWDAGFVYWKILIRKSRTGHAHMPRPHATPRNFRPAAGLSLGFYSVY